MANSKSAQNCFNIMIGNLSWNDSMSATPFELFSTFTHYDEFGTAYLRILKFSFDCLSLSFILFIFSLLFFLTKIVALERSNNTGIEDFLLKCASNPTATKGMLGYLADHIYFVQCQRALSVAEKHILAGICKSTNFLQLDPMVQQIAQLFVSMHFAI